MYNVMQPRYAAPLYKNVRYKYNFFLNKKYYIADNELLDLLNQHLDEWIEPTLVGIGFNLWLKPEHKQLESSQSHFAAADR